MTDKNQRKVILKAGDKRKALHIADNDGKSDQHRMPFNRGTVEFPEVVKVLNSGIFNLEIPGERSVPLELNDAKIGYIKACCQYLMRI